MNIDKILILNAAHAQISLLAIVATCVGNFEHRTCKDKRRDTKIDAVLINIRPALVFAPLIFHPGAADVQPC